LALEQLGVFGPLPPTPAVVGSENATTTTYEKVPAQAAQTPELATGGLSHAQFGFGQTFQPNQARHARYNAAIERQKWLYDVLVKNNTV
jgi:hypothetical protein